MIICAVEDAGLADVLCRRLPIKDTNPAKRITLGAAKDGALTKVDERWLVPQVQNALIPLPQRTTAVRLEPPPVHRGPFPYLLPLNGLRPLLR